MKTSTTHSAVPVWRVVIIEDSPEDRAEIRRLLLKGSERRYQFVEAETGAAGLRTVLDASSGLPECVVLDYTLPDMNAMEVLAAMVGADGLTICPVVVLTGTADARLGPAVLRAGAQDFIGKGWMSAESLTRAVENAAERWAMTRELKARTVALQASQAQLKLGVEVAGLGVNRIDYETGTVVLDPIAAALFGLAAGVPLPRSVIHATFHPDDKDEVVRRMDQSLDPAGEGTFGMEHRVVHPDRSVHWLSVKMQVIFAETAGIRRPVTSVLAAVDITDRKVGEEQLRASEQFNRSLMDGTADCVKVLDMDGRLVHMNTPGLCALEIDDFGSVCGQEWKAIWPADSRGDIERSVARAVGGEVSSFQAYFPTAKGTPKWWEVTVSPVRDADGGQVVRLLAVSRDITERKRAEERYRESEGRVRQVIDSMFTFVGMIAPDGTLTEANHAPLAIAGLTRSDVIGKPFWDCYWWNYDPAVQDRLRAGFDRAARGEIVRYDETIRIANNGRAVIDLMLQPVFEGGQLRFVIPSAADITERKQAEEKLRRLAAELSEADRRKDEFLATLAHELRNPLAPIRNGLELIKLAGGRAATVEKARSMMERQVTQMVRLVDDLMDVSRIRTGKLELRKERVPLVAVLNSAVETSRPLIEQMGHELTVTLPKQPLMVDADMTRLAQVFLNLLNNAAKYSDRGGHIRLNVERQGSDVVVTVTDTGIGLAADQLPHIFEMFTQIGGSLERSQGGLGIGLMLVKRLVDMHGGGVEAKSEGPGMGSEFVVRLPVVIEASQAQVSGDDDEPAAPESSLRILIVDDNRDAADSLSEMLKMMGNDTRTAYDGQQGVDMAGEYRPDVILFDIGLPKLNGHEACRLIREQPWGKGVALIAVTGWGQDKDRRRSDEAGFDHHLVKPVDPQALMKLIAGLVAG
jgi:PAS domain S-box-containing protein